MKMKSEHIVPLSTQSIDVICDLRKLNDGRRYVFGNQAAHEKPMSENTMIYARYRMGYHSRATAHGFRATASTILNEQGFRPDVIERQLAHVERNKVRAAYHRTEYIAERRKMMQHWADHLDSLEGRIWQRHRPCWTQYGCENRHEADVRHALRLSALARRAEARSERGTLPSQNSTQRRVMPGDQVIGA